MAPNAAKRCTRACIANTDCLTQTRCINVAGENLCVWEDTGRICNNAQACNFACLISQQYCTTNCTSGADCPNGYGCMNVQNQNICVKAEAPCGPGDTAACIAPAACDTSASLVVAGCTLVCNTASDCPQRAAGLAPWSCQGGICARPGDVLGPLEGGATPAQYACDANSQPVNMCNDAQHIDFVAFNIPPPPVVNCNSPTTTDGAPGDSCVDSCRYQGGCRWGFACVAIGGIGNGRIGLCIPTGSGEPGAACANDTQCVFGYCSKNKCSRDCTADGICPGGLACVAVGGPPVEGQAFRRCE
jgi:hypothetical protein